jgi:hypothetical protein
MTGLAGSEDPKTALVVATYTWDVSSAEHPGDRVVRTGELSLVPSSAAGKTTWRIGAYTIAVERTVGDETTTTTATTEAPG